MGEKNKLIMAIDVGTQSVRAVVCDSQGNIVANERIVSKPCIVKKFGWAEAEPDSFWDNVCYCTNKVKEKLKDDMKNIQGVSITTNRDNILCVDKDGKPLRDWITWMDQRLSPEAVISTKKETQGLSKVIRYVKKSFFDMVSTRSKFNWIKIHEPEIYAKTYKFLTLCGHITYKFTGKFNDAIGLQMGVYPYDIAHFDFYNLKAIYDIVGVTRDKLADEVFQSGEIMGLVTKEAEAISGIPAGTPIIAAGGDKQCEVIGAGCFNSDDAVVSYGTMAAVCTVIDKFFEGKNKSFYTWASSYPGKWTPEFYVDRGYWLVTWFCNQYAKEKDFPAFLEEMNKQSEKIPAGSQGLLVFPFWAPHYVLYPDARGVIFGFTDDHTPAHVYKAILESIAYILRDGLNLIERKNGKKASRLIVVGGGSKSDVAMQLTADIFNKEVVRVSSGEIGAVGALAIGGASVKIFDSIESGVNSLIKPVKVFKPIPENVKTYEHIYKEIYSKIYKDNIVTFRRLKKLTEK